MCFSEFLSVTCGYAPTFVYTCMYICMYIHVHVHVCTHLFTLHWRKSGASNLVLTLLFRGPNCNLWLCIIYINFCILACRYILSYALNQCTCICIYTHVFRCSPLCIVLLLVPFLIVSLYTATCTCTLYVRALSFVYLYMYTIHVCMHLIHSCHRASSVN